MTAAATPNKPAAANANAGSALPQLAQPRRGQQNKELVLDMMKGTGFDPDVWHVMDQEDDALVAEEVLHGAVSGAFVYNFSIQGTPVQGISVVGAAHLAHKYGGLKHRIVATTEKRGTLFKFTSYPSDGSPMSVTAANVPELGDDPDYYTAVVEISNIKNGNTVQVERTELRFERKRDGGVYERPSYQAIAQSKAYRNAVLRVVPQDVQAQFKQACIAQGNSKEITAGVLDQKRKGIIAYAAKNAIPVSREAVFSLGVAEINGLGQATNEGVPAFVRAGDALGIITQQVSDQSGHDPETGEVREGKPAQQQAEQRQPAARAGTGQRRQQAPTQQPAQQQPQDQRPQQGGGTKPRQQAQQQRPQGDPPYEESNRDLTDEMPAHLRRQPAPTQEQPDLIGDEQNQEDDGFRD